MLGWIPALMWMGCIFFLSSLPGDEVPLPDIPFIDKAAHAVVYAVLGGLIVLRKGFGQKLRGEAPIQWTQGGRLPLLLGMLYGVTDEIHQLFVPGRKFDLMDMAADAAGVALGFWLLRSWDGRRPLQRI